MKRLLDQESIRICIQAQTTECSGASKYLPFLAREISEKRFQVALQDFKTLSWPTAQLPPSAWSLSGHCTELPFDTA
jgi:hypothetical protein